MAQVTKIIQNKAQCLKCGDIIESKSRHDFVACSCGEVFVDGGTEYLRSGAHDPRNFINLAITKEFDIEDLTNSD